MTVTLTTTPTTTLPTTRGRSLGIGNALRSEWIKIRSVRSTTWTLVAMTLISVGIAVIASVTNSNQWSHMSLIEQLRFDPTKSTLQGLLFSQLVIGVLGVLVVSAEYGTGTIRATLAATPNRPRVLATKAAVFAAVAFVVGQLLAFAAFFVGQALLSPAPHASLSQPGVLRAVIGAGLLIPVLGLFALGIGTIVRHTAGAITTFVAAMFVLPLILQALPSSVANPVMKFLPFKIGDAMTSVQPAHTVPHVNTGSAFSPWVGFAVLCGYALIALVAGGILMVRRDA
jgi:hypothetical protein